MAGQAHEAHETDAAGEMEGARTRSRHASCGAEPPSPSSLAQQAAAPQGAATRGFSFSASLPTRLHSPACPPPAHRQQPSDAAPPSVRLAPWPTPCAHPWPRACPHHAHLSARGPPCYLCAVHDLPPKYRRREARGWQRVREKLARLSVVTLAPQEAGGPQGQSPSASIFTISDWSVRDPSSAAPQQETHASATAAPRCWGPQERDNLTFDGQYAAECHIGASRQPPPPAAPPAAEEGSSTPPSPLHLSTVDMMAPPPYSPPLAANALLAPPFPSAETPPACPTIKCSRRMVCQILYSLLLALATSTLVISYEQPFLVIASVVVFLTLFVFLPIIALLECLFRLKMEREFSHHFIGLINFSQTRCTNPIV